MKIGASVMLAAIVGFTALWFLGAQAGENARVVPPPAADEKAAPDAPLETAVLAGGCFWGVEGVFQHVKGVKHVLAGYSGGARATAHYRLVGTETTGHAESVRIQYDPHQVTYGQLLRVFFSVAHDPTELNRQGPDTGPSYRSNIFYANAEQKRIATAYIAQLEKAHVFGQPIVTRIDPLTGFYPAEDYHQDFLVNHPTYPYIVINDLPKIENLKRLLPQLYREKPVTGASPA